MNLAMTSTSFATSVVAAAGRFISLGWFINCDTNAERLFEHVSHVLVMGIEKPSLVVVVMVIVR